MQKGRTCKRRELASKLDRDLDLQVHPQLVLHQLRVTADPIDPVPERVQIDRIPERHSEFTAPRLSQLTYLQIVNIQVYKSKEAMITSKMNIGSRGSRGSEGVFRNLCILISEYAEAHTN